MKAKDLWLEFVNDSLGFPMCGLCGNTGIVDTTEHVISPRGQLCGVRDYCICPNGRVRKKKSEKQK